MTMRTLLITTMAVGLIGCTTQSKVVMRIVDPYSQAVYELTDKPCPRSLRGYPYTFTYQGTIEGCYNNLEREQRIDFISAQDWSTRVTYTYAQLLQAKRNYEGSQNFIMRNIVPNAPTPQPIPKQPMIQCFSNGFGTITCN